MPGNKKWLIVGRWWPAPLIAARGRQKQANLCESEAYKVSSRKVSAVTQRSSVWAGDWGAKYLKTLSLT